MVELDIIKCVSCGQCIRACSPECFTESAEGPPVIRYPDACISCGHCVAVCPAEALVLPGVPLDMFRPWSRPDIPAEDLKELMIGRRSIRRYEDRQVPEDKIRSLLEAASHAGTASNGLSERYIVLQNPDMMAELELAVVDAFWRLGLKYLGNPLLRRLLAIFAGVETASQSTAFYDRVRRWKSGGSRKGMVFRNAPTVIIVEGLKRNPLVKSNAALAVRNIELLAESMGLGTC